MDDILSMSFFYLCNFLHSKTIHCIFLHCIFLYCNIILFQYGTFMFRYDTHLPIDFWRIYRYQSGRCPEPHQEPVPGPICYVAQNQAESDHRSDSLQAYLLFSKSRTLQGCYAAPWLTFFSWPHTDFVLWYNWVIINVSRETFFYLKKNRKPLKAFRSIVIPTIEEFYMTDLL